MYNIIINVIAWLAIIQFVLLVLWHIIIYIHVKISEDYDYVSIRRNTYLFDTEYKEWYIIPTISLHITTTSTNINITWLKWNLSINYMLVTELDEAAEHEIKVKIKNES